jgi:hypothetical protein
MGANRGRDIPDNTPAFLTKELIDLWIAAEGARQKEAMSALRSEIKDELHKFDSGQLHLIHNMEKLAGDGKQDIGAVPRLEKLVNDYIVENRAASSKASEERQRVEEQIKRWKLIPVFTRNFYKIVAALATLALALVSLWSFYHPRPVVLTPQQVQEIRKAP